MQDLKGKKIIVCGGSGQMGRNICSHIREIEAIPIIVDSNIEKQETDTAFECDLSNSTATELIFDKLFKIHPEVNYLVNALRIRKKIDINDNICSMSASISSELNAYLYPMHFFCNKKREGGALVNISSILGRRISLDVPLDYHVAKASIEQASRYYAARYKDHKVRVNCIAPGLISKGDSEIQSINPNDSHYSQLARKLPLQRSGSQSEVVSLITFLLSEASGFLLGANILIDGGGDLIEITST